MGRMIEFARPDGGATRGYLAAGGERRAGIVVIQEWWGLNDQICGVSDRLARAGYDALAPDLYRGRLTEDTDEAGHLMAGLDFVDATHQDLRGAVRHLKQGRGAVAVMGFCMGGALAIAAAAHIGECDAAICFYGIPPRDVAKPADIAVPFQAHFADNDDWCTPAAVDALEAEMKAAGREAELYRYAAAHAFCNEASDAYDVAGARLAWRRATSFLEATLKA